MADRELVNISRAGELLGLSYSSLMTAIDRGEIKVALTYEKTRGQSGHLLSREDIEEYRKVLVTRYGTYKNDTYTQRADRLRKRRIPAART